MNLARIDMGVGELDAAERRLSEIVEPPAPEAAGPRQRRASCWATPSMAPDATDEAFAAYAAARPSCRRIFASEFATSRATRSLRPRSCGPCWRSFSETPAEPGPASAPSGAAPARGHAFLFGFPRSGTTLLEQVIATHPDMVALGERPVMIDAEVEFLSRAGGMTRLAGTVSDLLEPFRDAYWRRVREFGVNPRGKVFVDKHPLSTIRLPLIHKVFPDAKIIFALRDPRDVVLSCFRRSFNMNASMYEFNTFDERGAVLRRRDDGRRDLF